MMGKPKTPKKRKWTRKYVQVGILKTTVDSLLDYGKTPFGCIAIEQIVEHILGEWLKGHNWKESKIPLLDKERGIK